MVVVFLFCGVCTSVYALDPREYAVEASIEVLTAPTALRLSWRPSQFARSYQIRRRFQGASDWGAPRASLPGTAREYTDSDVSVGSSYEYEIQMESTVAATPGPWVNGYGYISGGISLPLVEQKGKVLLLVDSSLAASVGNELAVFQQDLIGAGWTPVRRDVSRASSVPEVKNIVRAEYNADPSNMRAALLIGHIPVPYSGNIAPDLHESHRGAWPADVYYADIDGTWTDSTVNIVAADNPDNDNHPGDGKFDQSQIPSSVELELGRIDFWDLPAFSPRSEVDLLRVYLRKNHEFRHRVFTAARRGLIRDNFGDLDGDAPAVDAWRHYSQFFGPGHVQEVGPGAFFPTLQSESFLWAYGCGGGGYTKADGVGSTTDFATMDPHAVFLMLHGSYFGDWNITDNFLRAAIANPNFTLASIWSGLPHWFMHPLAMGATIGSCARLAQNNVGDYKSHENLSPNQVHIALLGDPTLEMFPVIPPSNLTGAASGNVNLSWSPSADQDLAGYHIYYSSSAAGPFQRLTSSPIAETAFAHAIGQGTHHYMVRAIKLERTGSGTFFNASQGVFTTVTKSTSGALPVVAISTEDGDVSEANSNSGTIRITRNSADENSLIVELLFGGTAQNGSDYEPIGTSIAIPAGSADATITVTPKFDTQVEGEETVTIQLGTNGAYTIGSPSFAFLKIRDAVNQPPAISAIPNQTLAAGASTGALQFQVSDSETAADALQVRGTSSNPKLVETNGIVFGGTAANRTVQINPVTGASGTAVITVIVSDGVNETTTTFSVTMTLPNRAPNAFPKNVATVENSPVGILLTGQDPEGQAITFLIKAPPANGVLSGTAPNIVYTPKPNYFGPDSFVFAASDGQLESLGAQVSINVTPVNRPPVAQAASVGTDEDTPVSITLGGSDPNGDALQFELLTPPTKGTLTGSGATFVYVPRSNVFGIDAFTFRAGDGEFASAPASISINIVSKNDPPRADNLQVQVTEDQAADFILPGADVDNDLLTYQVVGLPGNGTISGTPPNLHYTPVRNFNGADALRFTVSDGAATSSVATVSFFVAAVNDAPAATSQTLEAEEDIALVVTIGATDPEVEALTYRITEMPRLGQLTGTPPTLAYIPFADAHGLDSFTFVANDGLLDSAPAIVSINIRAKNDAPSIGPVLAQTIRKNGSLVGIALLVEDADRPISDLLVTAESSNLSLITPEGITVTLEGENRQLSLTPVKNAVGTTLITLTVSDGQASSQSTFTLTVTNTAPVAVMDTISGPSGTLSIPAAELTKNDTDVDGDQLTVVAVTQSRLGRTVLLTNNTVTYLGDGSSSEDSFSYTVEDDSHETATATVSLTLQRTARIDSMKTAGGNAVLSFTGPADRAFRVKSSIDAQTWTDAGGGRSDASGHGEFTEAGGAGAHHRFYRIEWP